MEEVEDLNEVQLDKEAQFRCSDEYTECKHVTRCHALKLIPQTWRCWECRTNVCKPCRRVNVTNQDKDEVSMFGSFKLKGFDNPAMSLCAKCAEYFKVKMGRYPNEPIVAPVRNPPATMPGVAATSMRNHATKEDRRAAKIAKKE
ncbi:hypothetical protein CYMTET_6278 [Cymbomonas tetramitiformis]|uniref:Uncharacterized protein n=1 Tax=Cymbomonas tetramitiformis TaxID=36881 RepID=A0AAE0GXF6_9CHLO|nr:hypothetical protein CYMTET_6278 [Cymbomonas tetramitiformis]